MPAPLARDPQSGSYFTVDPQTREWRPLNEEEFGNLRPSAALDQMGVTPFERFTLKNFLNPGVASNWLKSRGYEVMPYGSGLNFAVRKPGGDGAWRVVDPARGGVKEFFQDMLDISIGDVLLPFLGGASGGVTGTAAGPAGALAGAAAGGVLSEYAREGIGELLTGERGNVDPTAVALAGGLNAAALGAGKVVGLGAKKAAGVLTRGLSEYGSLTRGGETLLSRLTGIRPAQGMRVFDIISYAAKNTGRSMVTPVDVLDTYVQHMDNIAAPRIGNLIGYRDALLDGVTVNMRPVIEKQLAAGGERGRFVRSILREFVPDRVDPAEAQMNDDLIALLSPPTRAQARQVAIATGQNPNAVGGIYDGMMSNWLTQMETLDAPIAARVRTVLQKAVADAEGYAGVAAEVPGAARPISSEKLRDVRNFVGKWVGQFHDDLRAQGLGNYSGPLTDNVVMLDDEIHTLASARDTLRKYFGVNRESAENAIRGAFNPGNERYIRAIKDYDNAFPGVEFGRILRGIAAPSAAGVPGTAEGMAREAFVGSQFSPRIGPRATFGHPEAISRPTATGSPLGLAFTTSLLGGLGGFGVGGPVGAAVGGAAGSTLGFLAFSPRALVGVTPMIVKGGRAVRGAMTRVAAVQPSPVLGPTMAAAAATALQGIARSEMGKSMVRQSESREPKRKLFLGG